MQTMGHRCSVGGGGTSDRQEIKKAVGTLYYGASAIWLADSRYNLMLEYLYIIDRHFTSTGDIERGYAMIINPACRRTINIDKLQIVPGIGFPIAFSHGLTDLRIFLHLSFEHPF